MFFQLEDDTEGTREEDAFDRGECNHAFGKACSGGVTPFEGPLCFLLNAGYGFDRLTEVCFLHRVLDVCVDEERVRLTVDVLNDNLEAVETSGFG